MDERSTGLGDQRVQPLERLGRVGGAEVDRGAVASRRRDLRLARALPHDDEAVDSLRNGPPRERLRVVPRRDPDHAACLLLRAERGELVEDAADLEGTGLLEELRLQRDAVAERARGERGCAVDAAADPLGRLEHVLPGESSAVDAVDPMPRSYSPRMRERVRLVITDDLRRSRLTVFFRLLLAIPHILWVILWTIAVVPAALVTWFATLVAGRPPEALHGFLSAYTRYSTHLSAYLFLAANPYPGFTGEPGYPVDLELPDPAPQARWKTAFRLVLALPALLLTAVLGTGLTGGGGGGGSTSSGADPDWSYLLSGGGLVAVCGILGWFAALALGRMPSGLRNLAGYGLGYSAQTIAYLLFLTDAYPNSDPGASGPPWGLPAHAIRVEHGRRRQALASYGALPLPARAAAPRLAHCSGASSRSSQAS